MIKNPFKPTMGMTPPLLVGREEILNDVEFALDNGAGTHERVTVITGPRGIGKTAVLNAIEDLALQHGWTYFSETATKGFVQRLISSAQAKIAELSPQSQRKLTGVSLSGVGSLDWKSVEPAATSPSLRQILTRVLDLIDEADEKLGQSTGLFITLDELHHLQRDEIIELATTVQHLIRESRNIALFMAGIPGSVKPLLGNDAGRNPITFLRRANRVTLGRGNRFCAPGAVGSGPESWVALGEGRIGRGSAGLRRLSVHDTVGRPVLICCSRG